MFVNKLLTYLTCAYFKTKKVFQCEIFDILFSCKNEDIDKFSNLHWCTFKLALPKPETNVLKKIYDYIYS